MKRLIAVALILLPASADARNCRVNVCNQEILVATPFAVAVGVPVASYAPVGYSYCPTPAAPNVTVNINANDLAAKVSDEVVAKLNAAVQQNTPLDQPLPPVPGPSAAPPDQPQPPPPSTTPSPKATGVPTPPAAPQSVVASVFSSKCAKCHNTGDVAKGKPQLIESSLTCEQRLAAIAAATSGKMPNGNGPLDPDSLGKFIMQMSQIPNQKSQPQ
jgi:hypothetical protein